MNPLATGSVLNTNKNAAISRGVFVCEGFSPGSSRAEVYLHNGSQDYDLMGFTQDQITRDVLDQFESHRQLLGRMYS